MGLFSGKTRQQLNLPHAPAKLITTSHQSWAPMWIVPESMYCVLFIACAETTEIVRQNFYVVEKLSGVKVLSENLDL